MKTKTIPCIAAISWCFLMFASVAAQTPPLSEMPFETVSKGEISYFGYRNFNFGGADLVIRDKQSWEEFWRQHMSGTTPMPAVPSVDFTAEMVVVSVMGIQPTGGGPKAAVLRVEIDAKKTLRVLVENDETQGMLDVLTSPFHIVKIKKANVKSVVFEHRKVRNPTT